MREFNLEEAKKGAKVCTRNGYPLKITKWEGNPNDCYPISADLIIENEYLYMTYTIDGKYIYSENYECEWDLMMEE